MNLSLKEEEDEIECEWARENQKVTTTYPEMFCENCKIDYDCANKSRKTPVSETRKINKKNPKKKTKTNVVKNKSQIEWSLPREIWLKLFVFCLHYSYTNQHLFKDNRAFELFITS